MEPEKKRWYDELNLKKTCAEYRVKLYQCPQFLFILMGFIIILAIFATYVVASRYQEPEIAALTVLILSAALLFIGYLIVSAFEQVAVSSRSKSEFISIMSHQLRSPLSAIKWQLNLLAQGQGGSIDSVKNYLDAMVEQNERMIRAVNDLLDVNRIEDRDLVLRPSAWSMKDMTFKVIDEHQKYAAAHNARLEVMAGDRLPLVFADEEKLKRVIEHLVENAISYNQNGGRIFVSIENYGGDRVFWKITDEGLGLSRDEQKRVFEKFFRSPSAARYRTEGSGVGLFIAKSIIKLSGGDIGFYSQKDKGSTFWFSLPIRGDALSVKK